MWIKLDGMLRQRDSLLRPAAIVHRLSEKMVGDRHIRIEGQGVFELADGLLMLPLI